MKKEILEAAVRLFMMKGYINTSMDDIAEAVGLTKGGLYHHIDKKEDLLAAIHEQILDNFFSRVEAAVKAETDPREKLVGWIRAHTSIVQEFQPQIKVFFTEIDNLSDESFRRMIRKRDAAQHMLRDIISEGIASGAMRQDINPNIMSFLILGMINWLYMWYRPKGAISPEEIVRNIHEVIFGGVVERRGLGEEDGTGEALPKESALPESTSQAKR